MHTGFLPETHHDPLGHGELPLPGGKGGVTYYKQKTHPSLLDQQNTETCVANAVAGALRELAGGDELPSRAWIYRYGRELGGRRELNTGMRFSEAVAAIGRWGVPAERWWEFVPKEINEDPSFEGPLEATKHAFDQRHELQMHPLWPDQIASAVIDGYRVVTAFEVDERFGSGSFEEPWSLTTPSGVYHAVQLVGITGPDYLILNSYGAWGPQNDGIAVVSGKTVRDGLGSFVIRKAPNYRGQS